jgi:hypothetical protein
MFWWEMCGEERDLAVSGNGVYGGGGPTVVVVGMAAVVVAVVVVVVVVVVTAELRGRTMGGTNGVKRKGPLGNAAVVVEDARLRPADDDARLRTIVGVMLLRG